MEQGEKKFGAIAESVDVNQYDKLAATLSNLSKDFLSLINTGLGPLIELLAKSQGLLLGVMVMFASTIAKQVLPSLADMGRKTADLAKAETKAAGNRLKNLKVSAQMPKVFRNAAKAMSQGKLTQVEFDKALRSTSQSMARHSQGLKQIELNNYEGVRAYAKKRMVMWQVNAARQDLIRNMQIHATAQARENAGTALQVIGQGNLFRGVKLLTAAIAEYTTRTLAATAAGSRFTKTLGIMRIAAFATATAFRAVGSAIMAMIGPIGLAISIGMLLYDVFKDSLFPVDKVKQDTNEIIDSLTSIDDAAKSLNQTLRREGGVNASSLMAGYKITSGILSDTTSHIRAIDKSAREATGLTDLTNQLSEATQAAETFTNDPSTKGKRNAMKRSAIEYIDTDMLGKTKKEYDDEVKRLGKEVNEAKREFFIARQAETVRFLEATASRIANNPRLKQLGGKVIGVISDLHTEVAGMDLTNMSEADVEKWANQIGTRAESLNGLISSFSGAADAGQQLKASFNAVAQKETSPFDDIIRDVEKVSQKYDDFVASAADESLGIDTATQTEFLQALQKELGFTKEAFDITLAGDFLEKAKDLRRIFVTTKAEVKELTNQHRLLNKVGASSKTVELLKAQNTAEENILKRKLEGNEAELEGLFIAQAGEGQRKAFHAARAQGEEELIAFIKSQGEVGEKLHKQIAERLELLSQEKSEHQKIYEEELRRIEVEKAILNAKKQLFSAQKTELQNIIKIHEAQLQLQKAQNTGRALREGIDATPGDQLRTFIKFSTERRQVALMEFNLAKQRIKLEYELLKAKVALDKANLQQALDDAADEDKQGIRDAITSLDTLPGIMEEVFSAQETAARSSYDLSLKELDVEKEKLRLANLRVLIGEGALSSGAFGKGGKGIVNFSRNMTKAMDSANARAQDNYVKAWTKEAMNWGMDHEAAAETATMFLKNELEGNTFDINTNLTGLEKIETIMGPISEMFSSMSEMGGPDSNLLATLGAQTDQWSAITTALGQGGDDDSAATAMKEMFGEGNPFEKMQEMFGEGGDLIQGIKGVAGAFAVIAGTLATIYAIKSAGTADRIAAIDKEIAATKKLGGTTEAKEKRLMALEAKKESLKKKQFEQNKKMMMAQAAMGIALGVINALSLIFPLNFIMAGIVAALGAYQLAIIAGMSYQGGAATASVPSGPGAIGIGERSNKVDIASGRGNAAGELAYLRGDRGSGTGAHDFRPAFAGTRYRATGGAAYVVGEQGPELFIPSVPGRVVPNDEMAATAPVGAVNFTINAIDATGVEEVLVGQRGNIIGMIRESANEYGTNFLEEVDTQAYTDTTEGTVYGRA